MRSAGRVTTPGMGFRNPMFGPARNIPFQFLPSMLKAVKNGWTPPTVWLEPMVLHPPTPIPTDAPRPKKLVRLEDRLKRIWLERHPGASKISMIAADVGYEKYWHHPCSSFAWRQARLMKQGVPQETAYEMVEEQDRKAREYRQIERLLAMEQFEEFGAKEIDTAEKFLSPSVFDHKLPEVQLEEIIELRKKRGLKAPLDAREMPRGISFLELRKLVERKPEISHYIDLEKLGPLFEATGVPIPLPPEDDEADDQDGRDFDEDEDAPVKIQAKEIVPRKEMNLEDDDLKVAMLDRLYGNEGSIHMRKYTAMLKKMMGQKDEEGDSEANEISTGGSEDDGDEDGERVSLREIGKRSQFSAYDVQAMNEYMESLYEEAKEYKVDKWSLYLALYDMGKNQQAIPLHTQYLDPDAAPTKWTNMFAGMTNAEDIQPSDAEDFENVAADDLTDEEFNKMADMQTEDWEEALDSQDKHGKLALSNEDEEEGEDEDEDEDEEEFDNDYMDAAESQRKITLNLERILGIKRERTASARATLAESIENSEEGEQAVNIKALKSARAEFLSAAGLIDGPDPHLSPDIFNALPYDQRLNPEEFIQLHDDNQKEALYEALQGIERSSRLPVWEELVRILEMGELVPEVRNSKGKTRKSTTANAPQGLEAILKQRRAERQQSSNEAK